MVLAKSEKVRVGLLGKLLEVKVIVRRLVMVVVLLFGNGVVPGVLAVERAWGPAIGTLVEIRAQDDSGRERTLADLTGKKGLLLFLNRSADW